MPYFITHGPAHRGANGAVMPTDENDQDGYFISTIPRGGATPLPRRPQPLLLLFIVCPPLSGGEWI